MFIAVDLFYHNSTEEKICMQGVPADNPYN